MTRQPLRVAIIIGSTRKGRFGPVAARWIQEYVDRRDDMTADLVDLVDAALPVVFNDFGEEPPPEVAALAPRLAAADAFVVVTPEYNHGYPASLKCAIDWYMEEWQAKPVAFVSYGGVSGGLRAVEQLRQIFAEVHAVSIRDSVSFANFWEVFDMDGRPRNQETAATGAKSMLDQLAWWGQALREARDRHPYGS